MRGRLRTIAFLVVIAALMIGSALLSGSGRDDAGPEGTLAFRRFLGLMGAQVRETDALPPSGTVVLFDDLREPEQARPIMDWVRRGGRLVLTDPASTIADELGVQAGGLSASVASRPACDAPEVQDVASIATPRLGGPLRTASATAVRCFPAGNGSLVIIEPLGAGRVIVLAEKTPFTNEFLRVGDNAIFALRATGADAGATIHVAPPLPPGAEPPRRSVWNTLPLAAKLVVIQLVIAAAVFALVRARRVGRPVPEEPPVVIPASELVRATARLTRSARARGTAGSMLRRATAARLARRVGAAGASPREVAAMLSNAGLGDEARIADALAGPDPVDDGELIALGRTLDELRARVEGGAR